MVSLLSSRCPVPSARLWAEVGLHGWKLYSSTIIEDDMSPSVLVIAVVDDDVSVRRALRRLLRSAGFIVETLASAQEFLAAGHLHQTGRLVLDIHLLGMTEFALQEHLTALGIAIPIIFITAHDDGPRRQRACAAGVADYLRKPFGKLALIKAIDSALERDPSGREDSRCVPDS
jgi:FixJ family two-component response regulator